jgi:large subunit ribosomal protein L28
MSRVCQVTGRRPVSGNNRSHSMRATKRQFVPNVQTRRFWVPSERRFVRLTVSARGIKIIDKVGIERVLADMRARGQKV